MHFEQLLEDNDNNLQEESKDNSSNLVFEEFPTNDLTYEQSNTREETNHNQEEDDFMANIAEENANSFPSCTGADDNSVEQNDGDVTLIDSSNDSKNNQEYNDYQMADETLAGENHAIIEKQEGEDPEATDLDAENISDDEIPAPEKEQVPDAEEVSDEDLPAPQRAELPADTEVVSEEEEPLKKDIKRKLEDYDPSDPTDEVEAPEKKVKTEGEMEKVEPKPKPQLPELDNHWKPVNEDSTNFPAWTLLLQYVDAEVSDTQYDLKCLCNPNKLNYRLTLKLHVKHMMHSWLIIHIVMDTGVNTLTLKSVMDPRRSVKRLVDIHLLITFFGV